MDDRNSDPDLSRAKAGGHSNAGGEMVFWFTKVAEHGNRVAQELLANAYAKGWFGLPRDTERAHYWRERLAQNSHTR